jgi:hypothetical protein
MHRRDVLRAGGATLAGGLPVLAGCTAPTGEAAFREGFESGLGAWTGDAAIGPEVDLAEFEWRVDVSDERAARGDRSLRVFNEGDYDDGTTWAVREVDVGVEAGRAYTIEVTAGFWSESESFNTLRDAVMRLGPDPPEAEEDFPNPGVNTTALGETPYGGLREPLWLAAGWREYAFEWTTPTLSTATLSLAVGTSVVWEGDATHFVDEVTVDATPQ